MDLDGDGHQDILSGSYSRTEISMAGLFQVLFGQKDGSFKKAEVLKGTDGQPLIIPAAEETQLENICTRPFAIDFDGDGDLDLVVGNFAGSFYLFQGEGKGKFRPKPEQLLAGDKPLQIKGHHSDPFVIDWDGDGDLDLLSGSSEGGVQWAQNTAGKGKPPQLAEFQSLIDAGAQITYGEVLRDEDLKGPASATRVWAADVNGDGKLDLLVGDLVDLVSPVGDLSEADFKKKFDQWQKEMSEAIQAYNAPNAEEKDRTAAQERFLKAYNEREQFIKEDETGFVWLYVRK